MAEHTSDRRPAVTMTATMGARVLLIDNYDSFVYNLVQELGELGAEPEVFRNDAIEVDAIRRSEPDAAGASCALIESLGATTPVLGVCLGHQCIGEVFGGSVVRHAVMHGKTSQISHDGRGVFAGLPDPFVATRYHSLVVDAGHVPDSLEVSARAEDGTIMGLRHRDLAVEGVQFHPESILTAGGHRLVANWLASCGQAVSPATIDAAQASLTVPV